jgi:hypothetical protein
MFIENFKRMEMEKKKVKPFKKGPVVPMIRYHSTMMKRVTSKKVKVEELENKNVEMLAADSKKKINKKDAVFERTFISFSHVPVLTEKFEAFKNPSAKKKKTPKLCTLTK